jgi:hypothetical protein
MRRMTFFFVFLIVLWCLITTHELPLCKMNGQDTEILEEVLTQYPTLTHLKKRENQWY